MKYTKIYIIILNYKGWKDTIECLESVLKSDYENYQIIVVDNDSQNKSMDMIIDWAEGKQEVIYDENTKLKHLSQPFKTKPIEYTYYTEEVAVAGGIKEKEKKLSNPLIFIQAGENRGFSAGNNIAIKYALKKNDFEYIWLLNNDTVIEKSTLGNLIKSFESRRLKEKLGILGIVQYYYDKPEEIQAIAGGFNRYKAKFWNYNTLNFDEKDIAYVYGASMLLSSEIVNKVGLLNEEYFIYYEEIDYVERLKNFGYIIGVDKSIKIFHKHGKSIKNEDNDFRIYMLEKNKIKFYKKYYKSLLMIPVVGTLKKFFWNILRMKKIKFIYLKSIKDGLLKWN